MECPLIVCDAERAVDFGSVVSSDSWPMRGPFVAAVDEDDFAGR
jgi:hypothetical protein